MGSTPCQEMRKTQGLCQLCQLCQTPETDGIQGDTRALLLNAEDEVHCTVCDWDDTLVRLRDAKGGQGRGVPKGRSPFRE